MTDSIVKARKTCLTIGLLFLGLSLWNLFRHRMPASYCLAVAAAVLLGIASFIPGWALRFHLVWMRLAAGLGYVNSRVLLSGAFYLILTPFGFLLKRFGHDPFHMRARATSSHWIPRSITRQPRERFERLF